MYKLQQESQSYYINSPAKIGVYAQSEYEVYLIESGNLEKSDIFKQGLYGKLRSKNCFS